MTGGLALGCALALDGAFGEPDALWRRLPHPAVLMGRAVAAADLRMNRAGVPGRRLRGALALAGLVGLATAPALLLGALPLAPLWEILAAAALLAQRSLCDHVTAVARALRSDLAEGRRSVGLIVGRDTAEMDAPSVVRAAVESAAENLSDGVIAPAFWFLVAGLPGMAVYKMVNTADSMIGYRTPRHEAFGWAAARTDDVLNWIPARLTALMIALQGGVLRHWGAIARNARTHRSPNAGWPEAAMAARLNVALAGPRSYHGTLRAYPWVWPEGDRAPGPETIDAAVSVLWRVWALALAAVVALGILTG